MRALLALVLLGCAGAPAAQPQTPTSLQMRELGQRTLAVPLVRPAATVEVSRLVPPWKELGEKVPPATKKLVERLAAATSAADAKPVAEALAKTKPAETASAAEWLVHGLALEDKARAGDDVLAKTLPLAIAAYARAATAPDAARWQAWIGYLSGNCREDIDDVLRADEDWRHALAASPPKAMVAELEWQLGRHAYEGHDGTLDDAVAHYERAAATGEEPVASHAKYHLMFALAARGSFREALAIADAQSRSTDAELAEEGKILTSRLVDLLGGPGRAGVAAPPVPNSEPDPTIGPLDRTLDTCWSLAGEGELATVDLVVEPVGDGKTDAKVKVALTPDDPRVSGAKKCLETMAPTALARVPGPFHVSVALSYLQGQP